jgi:hypothetical protein
MLSTIVAEELRSMLAPSFDAGGFVDLTVPSSAKLFQVPVAWLE